MGRNDLIEAYQNGLISRRSFVRGMMALGVSASVAVSLAEGIMANRSKAANIEESAPVKTQPTHTYDIRIAGDLLVTVTYPVHDNGTLGYPSIDPDDAKRVHPSDLHPHWLNEMAKMYMYGWNASKQARG